MKAVVLAGGLGTRLGHITANMPKPMAPVGGIPFLEYVLDHLVRGGVDEIVLAVSYKWEQIQDYFGQTYKDVALEYSVEDVPLGTGGAIRQAVERVAGEDIVIVNGDTLFPVDIGVMFEQHETAGALLTVAVRKVNDTGRFGRLVIDGDRTITAFMEKGGSGPGFINGGVYVLNRAVFSLARLPDHFSFETDLVEAELDKIHPLAFPSDSYFIDIGIPADYQRAEREVKFGKGAGTVS